MVSQRKKKKKSKINEGKKKEVNSDIERNEKEIRI